MTPRRRSLATSPRVGVLFTGLTLALLLLAGTASAVADSTILEHGSSTRYLANSADPGLGMSWTGPLFIEDGAWSSGQFGIGFETAPEGSGAHALLRTVVPVGTVSIFTRTTFTISDPTDITAIRLGLDYDDGVVAWINGVEVYRSPEMAVAGSSWDAVPDSHESSNGAIPDYTPLVEISAEALPLLQAGDNLLALGVWSNDAEDLLLVPQVTIESTFQDTLTRGPYLQIVTPSRATLRWRTATPTHSVVYYGGAWGDLQSNGLMAYDGVLETEHSIEISQLFPATRYYYAIGSSEGILAGNNSQFFIETHPTPGPPIDTRIWVLGDSGFTGPAQRAVRDSYYAFTGGLHTDLWLHVGDVSQSQGTDEQYQAEFFDVYQEMMRKTALWPTMGNHDAINSESGSLTGPYYENFSLPAYGEAGGLPSGTEAYYAVDYANIHVIVLNSNDVNRTTGGDMLTWLELDLAATDKDWIIGIWHHPPYTKGHHDSDDPVDSGGRSWEMRGNVLPMLDDYGVDLVLCGHSHSYERSFLLDGHYGTSGAVWAQPLLRAVVPARRPLRHIGHVDRGHEDRPR